MAKKKKEKSFSSFLNNPIDFTLVITILFLLGIGLVIWKRFYQTFSIFSSNNWTTNIGTTS